jgi:hypothetical protein
MDQTQFLLAPTVIRPVSNSLLSICGPWDNTALLKCRHPHCVALSFYIMSLPCHGRARGHPPPDSPQHPAGRVEDPLERGGGGCARVSTRVRGRFTTEHAGKVDGHPV